MWFLVLCGDELQVKGQERWKVVMNYLKRERDYYGERETWWVIFCVPSSVFSW
jgi:hypoxanthine phosphoribosyltransferase